MSSSVLFEFVISLGILKFTYAVELKNLASAKKQPKKHINASVASSPMLTNHSINTVDLKLLMRNDKNKDYSHDERDSINFNNNIEDDLSQAVTANFF